MNKAKPFITIFANNAPSTLKGKIIFYAKKYTKILINRRRGPDAVLESLVRGLREKNISFNINPPEKETADIVHALSGTESLKLALRLKSAGLVKKIIAGPNISILPSDDNKLLLNSMIDTLIVPSDWIKEAYINDASGIQNISAKVQVWPSGVAIPKIESLVPGKVRIEKPVLIFKKTVPEEIYKHVLKTLDEKNCDYRVLHYGLFLRKKYFKLLQHSRAMIYLQEVESQGLALQEAWAFDVPTLVWNKGSFTYPGKALTIHGQISAPYLTDKCGASFSGVADFDQCFTTFISALPLYSPRLYCAENLSDKISTDKYIKIVNETLSTNK